jgi:hypothetical protein
MTVCNLSFLQPDIAASTACVMVSSLILRIAVSGILLAERATDRWSRHDCSDVPEEKICAIVKTYFL